jgi:hypothetical protein
MKRATFLGLALLIAAAGGMRAGAAAAETAPKATREHKLPELPTPPSIEVVRPDAADLAEVDALLGRVVAEDAQDREAAVRELLEATPKQVSAIRFRLGSVADNADKEAMKRLLLKTRHELLDKKDDDESEKPSAGLDYLARLSQKAEPKSEAWRNLVTVLSLSRMLESIGSVEAVRGLVDVYARFGEFLRITTQNALSRLGDRAVPALIEAERHPAEKIAKWAVRELDMLGRGIPSEAVQTQDQAVLADVLRAYGRTRNPDAVRIVVSFANSERAQVREASRQAVALMGEVASWQLRDSYENVVGKKPPRDWAWERTARCSRSSIGYTSRKSRNSSKTVKRHARRATCRPCARASISCWHTIQISSNAPKLPQVTWRLPKPRRTSRVATPSPRSGARSGSIRP